MQLILLITLGFISRPGMCYKSTILKNKKILINLLAQLFLDTNLSIFLCTLCINIWYLYHLNVNSITLPTTQNTDIKRPKNININNSIRTSLIGAIVIWFITFNNIFISHINNYIVLWDSLYLSHNTTNYLFIITTILLLILLCGLVLTNQNISFSVEYIMFVFLICIVSYLLMSSTNLFLTIFLLEFIALLIFGKMAVSKIVYKKNQLETTNNLAKTQYSYGLFNSLFFQFWANFVSSVCLFFSLLNIHYIFGASNFFVINFLFMIISSNWYITSLFSTIILIILVTGLFIKLGLSPYQFFKIETYKGIPLYIIIVYTTLYLITYIYFFLFLFVYQLTSLREFTGFYIVFLLLFSLLYLVSLLFDTKNFKAFLSYSTLITISNIFIIVLIL